MMRGCVPIDASYVNMQFGRLIDPKKAGERGTSDEVECLGEITDYSGGERCGGVCGGCGQYIDEPAAPEPASEPMHKKHPIEIYRIGDGHKTLRSPLPNKGKGRSVTFTAECTTTQSSKSKNQNHFLMMLDGRCAR